MCTVNAAWATSLPAHGPTQVPLHQHRYLIDNTGTFNLIANIRSVDAVHSALLPIPVLSMLQRQPYCWHAEDLITNTGTFNLITDISFVDALSPKPALSTVVNAPINAVVNIITGASALGLIAGTSTFSFIALYMGPF
jgi:hypothetical protein